MQCGVQLVHADGAFTTAQQLSYLRFFKLVATTYKSDEMETRERDRKTLLWSPMGGMVDNLNPSRVRDMSHDLSG